MTRITARVPVRADLAGGTLDLWPLYVFHPGSRTVNVAISLWAECDVESLTDSSIEVVFTDTRFRGKYESVAAVAADERVALIAMALNHFHLSGIRITTRTEAPRGSGLGGSSALAVALVRALSAFAGDPVEGDSLLHLVRDLETRMLGVPAGVQDYYPPVYGGLAALHLEPGAIVRRPISLPLPELAEHMVLHYSGVAHFSGTNNWQMFKGQIEGDERVRKGFATISRISVEMERALENRDLRAAAVALNAEWEARKQLIDGISTPEVDEVISTAVAAGAWAGKVCGAGGGGCIVILTPPDRRKKVLAALAKAPGKTLDVAPVATGITVEEHRDQSALPFVHRRGIPGDQEIEQLWVSGAEGGAYRPYILGEAAITFDAPRHGIHQTVTRSLLAPVDLQDGMPKWQEAVAVAADSLDFRHAPEQGRESIEPRDRSLLLKTTVAGEELLRRTLLDTESMTLWFNPAFEIFSSPGETREEFIRRCLEQAERGLEGESARLEKTYRRRIDQLREKSDRERRDSRDKSEGVHDLKNNEVGIAWGQTLYNITSGRPATTESPRSPNEADYVGKIAQLQKSWERERDALRDELTARARDLEEVALSPSARDIQTRRYVLVWVPDAPR